MTERTSEHGLDPGHERMLVEASGISADTIKARGYRTALTAADLRRAGFAEYQRRTPALFIPLYGVTGELVGYQARPDSPRVSKGKTVKYEMPSGQAMVLDVHPAVRHLLPDPNVPLLITEGVKKGDAAASRGYCAVALLGVWNWRGSNEFGGTTVLADWEHIALNARQVFVVFDSDVMTNPQVYKALVRLGAFLKGRGAAVFYIYLPSGAHGAKVGVDDFLASGKSVADVLALASSEIRYPAGDAPADDASGPYAETESGLVWHRPTKDGTVPTPLTNFTSRILAEIAEDDGADVRRVFELEAWLSGKRTRFTIPATQFAPMNWVPEHLGARAILWPGMSIREHARTAIQSLSGDIPERRVYAHTGWRHTAAGWCYLHAGGAIGPSGAVSDIEVSLPAALNGFRLPDVHVGAALRDAVRASLRSLEVAPDRISVPLFGTAYRAALGPADYSGHLVGPTGVAKSELAALSQQHFGQAMDARHLPGSWSSTGNALEGLAFYAKDALIVVDDFAPAGGVNDVQRLHRDADRLLRAQGNNAGRQRMRADATLRPPKPPRGTVLSTGEDIPVGQSLRARLVIIEVARGDVRWDVLTQCQSDARSGLYAAAMAGFLRWVAGRYDEIQKNLEQEVAALRATASAAGVHRRTPTNTAQLGVGIKSFLLGRQGLLEPFLVVSQRNVCQHSTQVGPSAFSGKLYRPSRLSRVNYMVVSRPLTGGLHPARYPAY